MTGTACQRRRQHAGQRAELRTVPAEERVGDAVDAGRVGLAAGNALDIAGLAVRLRDRAEEALGFDDLGNRPPRQVHARVRMPAVVDEVAAPEIGQSGEGGEKAPLIDEVVGTARQVVVSPATGREAGPSPICYSLLAGCVKRKRCRSHRSTQRC
jgi:hypothetical protein